jgi:adenylyl-sulfate kinase
VVIWLTGLSSAGKTTLGKSLLQHFHSKGHAVETLDGDLVRQHLCKDLDFSKKGRDENVRRIGFVAELLSRHGVNVIVSAISPYRAAREEIRIRIPDFVEVCVNAPVGVCESRDVMGLYRKARAGELLQFSGIDDPYESPAQPEVECRADRETIEESVQKSSNLFGLAIISTFELSTDLSMNQSSLPIQLCAAANSRESVPFTAARTDDQSDRPLELK